MSDCVDALPILRSSRFDRPLTYDSAGLTLEIGDVVRVPLGARDVIAYVVRGNYEADSSRALKPVAEKLATSRAFDETGLQLARFVSEQYLCTLGEALAAAVRGEAIPRLSQRLARSARAPEPEQYHSVPAELVALIWNDFEQTFSLERLLRHREARRIAPRSELLAHVQRLVRSGSLRRERELLEPRAREYTVRVLHPGEKPARGKRVRELYEFVAARPGAPRADAVLAGFGNALLRRALEMGAIRESSERPQRKRSIDTSALPPLTQEQERALVRIDAALDRRAFAQMLLHGVTASGKTLVYLRAIEHVVRAGGRAIVLVPEISLTPQIAARFEAVFGGGVAVLHSGLSDGERLSAWEACARGEIDVVVGARSAVFAPLRDVRLIVVDEAHESTYKQESVPRYHAVAVARERMRLGDAVLLLGSATPSLESYAAALAGRLELLQLRERAAGQPPPHTEIVDLTRELSGGKRSLLSATLTQAIAERIERREKSVLFVNRRGSARFLLCRSCGAVPGCPRCSVSLAVHREEGLLRCHYCDHRERISRRCAQCGSENLGELGAGTERVVAEVQRLFPSAKVLRMDSDTTTRVGDHARILRAFEEEGDVLVGTQMVAKGLDFPAVTLAGVVCADIGLHVPEFRAAERTFALAMQACGRSGRAGPGLAIVQTYAPQHPAIRFAAAHDYAGFAEEELEERRALGYPPSARLLYLGIIGRSRTHAANAAQRYASILRSAGAGDVLGPAPYPIARLDEEWRFRISLRTRRLSAARRAVRERIAPLAAADRRTRLAVNVDP